MIERTAPTLDTTPATTASTKTRVAPLSSHLTRERLLASESVCNAPNVHLLRPVFGKKQLNTSHRTCSTLAVRLEGEMFIVYFLCLWHKRFFHSCSFIH